jgi:glutaminyl-peptide cyclotransferase
MIGVLGNIPHFYNVMNIRFKISVCIILIILVVSGCSDKKKAQKKTIKNGSRIESIDYTVSKVYPHDTALFTEGFLFYGNQLFESTGSPEEFPSARSLIGIDDLKTGKIDVKVELDRNIFFGEGIVFYKNKLFQLTYKNQIGFVYDSKSYEKIGSFQYSNKEGWGFTTDGKSLIMSDGTNIITFLDPDNLKVIKILNITFNGSSALYVNELEYINGYLYANIWTTSNIAKIDLQTGKITGIIDLSKLFLEAKKKYPMAEATNGIAYDQTTDRIYVTGKFWPYIFQIKFEH